MSSYLPIRSLRIDDETFYALKKTHILKKKSIAERIKELLCIANVSTEAQRLEAEKKSKDYSLIDDIMGSS